MFSRGFILLFFLILLLTKPTSADLTDNKVIKNNQISATTLEFNTVESVDNSQSLSLFQINNIVPGGLQVASLRLRSDTPTKYNFAVSVNSTSQICDQVNLQFTQNQILYDGPLSKLNFDFTTSDKSTDIISILKLSSDVDFSQNQQLCVFDVVVTATPVSPSNFSQSKKLSNRLTLQL